MAAARIKAKKIAKDIKQQGVTNTLLALPMNKMLYMYLLCPHSEHQKTSVPILTLSPKKPVLLM
jgi:hypothetical protein